MHRCWLTKTWQLHPGNSDNGLESLSWQCKPGPIWKEMQLRCSFNTSSSSWHHGNDFICWNILREDSRRDRRTQAFVCTCEANGDIFVILPWRQQEFRSLEALFSCGMGCRRKPCLIYSLYCIECQATVYCHSGALSASWAVGLQNAAACLPSVCSHQSLKIRTCNWSYQTLWALLVWI